MVMATSIPCSQKNIQPERFRVPHGANQAKLNASVLVSSSEASDNDQPKFSGSRSGKGLPRAEVSKVAGLAAARKLATSILICISEVSTCALSTPGNASAGQSKPLSILLSVPFKVGDIITFHEDSYGATVFNEQKQTWATTAKSLATGQR
eukprot:3589525-Pleurochrysis_carterae.AAC.2